MCYKYIRPCRYEQSGCISSFKTCLLYTSFAPSAPPVFYNDANINTKSDISTSDHYEIISTPSAAISNNSSEMNKFAQQSTLESKNPETDTDSTDINPITNTDEINVETRDNVFIDEYFKIVGQVFSTYIIAEKGDKMLLIDQHAACLLYTSPYNIHIHITHSLPHNDIF